MNESCEKINFEFERFSFTQNYVQSFKNHSNFQIQSQIYHLLYNLKHLTNIFFRSDLETLFIKRD
jgi:hypothetical protein